MDLTTSSSDAHDSKSEKKENIKDDVDDLFGVLDTTVKLDDLFLENDEKETLFFDDGCILFRDDSL